MKNLANLMKQAQQVQAQMSEMQDKMSALEVSGSAAAGMVQITLNGKSEVKRVKIDKALVTPDEVEVLEDLIVAAFTDAKTKAEAAMQEEMSKISGGLSLPAGIKLPF